MEGLDLAVGGEGAEVVEGRAAAGYVCVGALGEAGDAVI